MNTSYVPTPPPETPWPCPEGQPFTYDDAGTVVCVTESPTPPPLVDTGGTPDATLLTLWIAVGLISLGLVAVAAARARKTARRSAR